MNTEGGQSHDLNNRKTLATPILIPQVNCGILSTQETVTLSSLSANGGKQEVRSVGEEVDEGDGEHASPGRLALHVAHLENTTQ